jgi:hypothetical protein
LFITLLPSKHRDRHCDNGYRHRRGCKPTQGAQRHWQGETARDAGAHGITSVNNATELNGADAEHAGRQIMLEIGVPRRALASSINSRLIIAPSSNPDLSANQARTSARRVLIFVTDVEIDHIEAMAGEN